VAEGDDFRAAWDAHHVAVRRYLARRVGRDAADDLLAGVFETAWRRWEVVPRDDTQLWWLLACARRLCANHSRSVTRRRSLIERIAVRSPRGGADDPTMEVLESAEVAAVLGALSPADREVLFLAVWDDLDVAGVAAVLGIGTEAAQKRVVRARSRFASAWESRPGLSAEWPDRTLTPMEDQ
jgi:RNA polymerase sigma-70 factor (ECF subfamily)